MMLLLEVGCGGCRLANPERIGISLGFLKGGEDHYQQDHCAGGPDKSTVDLWSDHAPGRGLNGTYSAFLYAGKAVELLSDFGARAKANASARFFLYLPCESSQLPAPRPLLTPDGQGTMCMRRFSRRPSS